jgi:hypothetical protein
MTDGVTVQARRTVRHGGSYWIPIGQPTGRVPMGDSAELQQDALTVMMLERFVPAGALS